MISREYILLLWRSPPVDAKDVTTHERAHILGRYSKNRPGSMVIIINGCENILLLRLDGGSKKAARVFSTTRRYQSNARLDFQTGPPRVFRWLMMFSFFFNTTGHRPLRGGLITVHEVRAHTKVTRDRSTWTTTDDPRGIEISYDCVILCTHAYCCCYCYYYYNASVSSFFVFTRYSKV